MTQIADPNPFARRKERGFDWARLVCDAAMLCLFYAVFAMIYPLDCDLNIHAGIAKDFDFRDLHSITSRLAYPMWHLLVSALYQLGLPLGTAAALICTLFKGAELWLCQRVMTASLDGRVPRGAITAASIALVLVTGLCLPWFNPRVYAGIGSPNTWHNPTQLTVLAMALLCVPYTAHCWAEFERRLPVSGDKTTLPWAKVLCLMILGVATLAAKPTFMQAFLPAAAVMFLVEWIRHPRNTRYFLQIILCFVPSAAYFLLQYLYYTGVVVPFTSGVAIGVTVESFLTTLRNAGLMMAFPLFVLVFGYREGMLRDKMTLLSVLMAAFAVVEAMMFRETGMRQDHGNFNWALMSSAFFLFLTMLIRYMGMLCDFCKNGARRWYEWLFYTAGGALLLWHLGSGVYYLCFLKASGNAF